MIPTQIQLTLRETKGAELTWAEGDANFKNLRDAILGLAQTVGASRVVIGAEPPVGERAGVLWVPTENYVGIFRWDSVNSVWVRVSDPALYGTSAGTGADYTLTVTWSFASYAAMAGRIIVIKSNHASTGASTFNVNSLGSTPMKKFASSGIADIAVGDILLNGIYMLVYDGAQFVLLNPTPPPPSIFLKSWVTDPLETVPVASGTRVIPHTLGVAPKIVRVVLVCQTNDVGYVAGDELEVSSLYMHNGTDDQVPIAVSSNSQNIYVTFSYETYSMRVVNRTPASSPAIDTTKWKLKAYAFA